MNNVHLFELLNASPRLDPASILLATVVAQWVIYLVALVLAVAWVLGDHASRGDLLHMLTATLLGLVLAEAISHTWPQPRPFALHLGTQ